MSEFVNTQENLPLRWRMKVAPLPPPLPPRLLPDHAPPQPSAAPPQQHGACPRAARHRPPTRPAPQAALCGGMLAMAIIGIWG